MKTGRSLLFILFLQLIILGAVCSAGAREPAAADARTRCSVCGMFVAKYPNWLAQIQYADIENTKFFDGVKDMMVFYFHPEQYDGGPREKMTALLVKDYYTLKWLSAKEAYYVVGSDQYGPMGHELVPFASREGAAAFSKDHHGKDILTFEEITPELIESLRLGQKMR